MGFKIEEFRRNKKMSQEELAEKADVSRTIISGLESGTIKITTTKTLEKLAAALEVRISDIFFEDDV